MAEFVRKNRVSASLASKKPLKNGVKALVKVDIENKLSYLFLLAKA